MNNKDDLIPVQEFAPSEVGELDLYQKRERIYTRKVEGFFQKVRLYTGWPLLLGFFLLPWINWDVRQAVLFDLPERQFYILGLTFWPQDFPMLAWLLIIAAWGLFAVTVWAGRVWCGYTCPQTVWITMFMWCEQVAEGSRNQRIKLDKQPMSAQKFGKKFLKQSMWWSIAGATGITFVGYFSPIRELIPSLLTFNLGFWEAAWITFFTCATYINAGYMREQLCQFVCPYARFQSVMFDKDTLVVSYDKNRGEPRGSRKKSAAPEELELGSCIDCELCVQVCPTGIDIRDGLQFECIGCALCIDACDSVMDKMEYPRGLVRYTNENELEGKPHRNLRPRLIGYATGLVIMVALFSYTIFERVPLRVDALRDRNQLYVETNDGLIENVYTLKILNMDQTLHEYRLDVTSSQEFEWVGESTVLVNSGEVLSVPVRLRVSPAQLAYPSVEITFTVTDTERVKHTNSTESRFIGPTR